MILTVSATATTKVTGSKHGAALAAAPFSQAWANVPRTTAGRKAKSVLVFGGEQDPAGFNQLQATQSSFWAVVEGNTAVIRGAYLIDDKGQYHLDLASSVTATKSTLTITIRPDAFWNWGGKKSPVTNADVAYTWKQIVDPNNQAASTTGYDQISGYTLKGTKTIVFKWKPGKPFATTAISSASSIRRRRSPASTGTRSGRSASVVRTASPSPTGPSCSRTSRRARASR